MLHAQHQSTGFQEKFVHDDALQFQKATNIAKQAGILLGRKLGHSNQEAVLLGDLLVRADLSEPGDADLHQAMKEVTESSCVHLSDLDIADIIALARTQSTHHTPHTEPHHQP
ncbi:MAG: ATPase inhibitor subunit zeta [Planctomycetota bacterium]|nr:ATPase inhibitor subunit zeta [Planctomycetota bacterium]